MSSNETSFNSSTEPPSSSSVVAQPLSGSLAEVTSHPQLPQEVLAHPAPKSIKRRIEQLKEGQKENSEANSSKRKAYTNEFKEIIKKKEQERRQRRREKRQRGEDERSSSLDSSRSTLSEDQTHDQAVPESPAVPFISPRSQQLTQEVYSPSVTSSRRRQDIGNAHSDVAAPRRVFVSPPRPDFRRDNRGLLSKNTGG